MTQSLGFSFDIYADAVADVVRQQNFKRAFVVGITGPWGSGKTTLMETVLSRLGTKDFVPVWFNAWSQSRQDSIWRALFARITSAFRHDMERRFATSTTAAPEYAVKKRADLESLLEDAERSLYAAFTKETPGEVHLDIGEVIKGGVKLGLRLLPGGDLGASMINWLDGVHGAKDEQLYKSGDVDALWKILKRDVAKEYVAKVESMEQFRRSIEEIAKATLENDRRVIVCIDDVDRCLPDEGLQVLEAIKLYLDLPQAVFIVAMDTDMLQHALDQRYLQQGRTRRITAELYAEKMLDLTFNIPPSRSQSFRKFALTLPGAKRLETHYDLIASVLPAQPRTWERFSSRLDLTWNILERLSSDNSLRDAKFQERFVKLQLLYFRAPGLLRAAGSFEKLAAIETVIFDAMNSKVAFLQAAALDAQKAIRTHSAKHDLVPQAAWPYLADPVLVEFFGTPPRFGDEFAGKNALESAFSLELGSDDPPQPASEQNPA